MENIITVRVSNMRSTNSERDVANQFEIRTNEGVYFQSYNTIIAFIKHGERKIYLDEGSWDYSRTTSKYRNIFTGLDTQETKKRIKDGSIILTNLN